MEYFVVLIFESHRMEEEEEAAARQSQTKAILIQRKTDWLGSPGRGIPSFAWQVALRVGLY
jgi:hypothetical protein